jgi:hypothetical protein
MLHRRHLHRGIILLKIIPHTPSPSLRVYGEKTWEVVIRLTIMTSCNITQFAFGQWISLAHNNDKTLYP